MVLETIAGLLDCILFSGFFLCFFYDLSRYRKVTAVFMTIVNFILHDDTGSFSTIQEEHTFENGHTIVVWSTGLEHCNDYWSVGV